MEFLWVIMYVSWHAIIEWKLSINKQKMGNQTCIFNMHVFFKGYELIMKLKREGIK